MQSHSNPITRTLINARYVLAGLLLSVTFTLTLLPARIPPSSGAAPAAQPPEGGWFSFANADDIRALAFDGDPSSGSGQGTLWAGTRAGGVVHWNLADPSTGLRTGGSYTQYLHPQTGLACSDVRDVLVGGAGSVWFATCQGLSVLSPDGTWQTFTVENTGGRLPSNNTTAIAADPAGYVWVGADQGWNGSSFEGGGLARWEWATGEWQTFNPPPSPAVIDVVVDHSGKVWVATKPYTTWIPPMDGEPGYWGRHGGGLAVWDGTTWQSYTSESGVADSITALAVDEAGNVWVGTAGNGAFAFTDRGQVHFRTQRGELADGYISAIGFGPAGRVWLGTRKFNGHGTGVSVLDPGSSLSDTSDDTWQQYTAEDGLAADLVTAIVGRGEQLWLGTSDPDGGGHGVSRFDATGFHPPLLTRPTNLAGNEITAVAEAPDGRLWVGSAHNGVSVLSPDRRTWTWYSMENTDPDGGPPWTGLRGNTVSSIAFDSGGRVWIGTRRTIYNVRWRSFEDGGLSMFDPAQSRWKTFTQQNTDDDGREPWQGLRSDEVSAVAVDWNDHVWIGSGNLQSFTGSGISVLDTAGTSDNLSTSSRQHLGDDRWTHYDVFDRLPSNNITGILADPIQQLIWVATAPFWTNGVRTGGGVGRFDGTTWTRWDSDDGLIAAEDEIRSIGLGLDGAVWAGGWTYQGSFHWPSGVGVDAVANRFDGASWEASGIFEDDGYVASLIVTTDGAVWAGTSRDGHGAAPATGGVKRLSAAGWTSLTTSNTGIVGDEIQVILQDEAGDVWFGSRTSGLSRHGRDLPAEPTPTPAAPWTPTPTPTFEVPISRIHEMYMPLMFANHVGVLPWPTPTPTITRTPPPSRTPTRTPTLAPGITPTVTLTAPPGMTRTAAPTASSTPTATATRPIPTVTPSPTQKPIPSGAWTPVTGVPPIDLFDVFFVETPGPASGLLVWAVGEQGVILHSSDGGANWAFQDGRTAETLRSVHFLDQRVGWVVGENGTIRHTADGGETWQSQNSPVVGEMLVAVGMTSPANGWALGADGTALRWNGIRWTIQSETGFKFTAVSLGSDDEGWATTAEADTVGRVVRLAGGQWLPTASFQGLHDIHVPAAGQGDVPRPLLRPGSAQDTSAEALTKGSSRGWAVGSRGTVARQLEGRWEYVSRPPTGGQALYAVHSLGPDRAWVMGAGGLMFYFNQDHWENKTDSRITRQTIHAIRMTPDGRQGWAVGEAGTESGTILRFLAGP